VVKSEHDPQNRCKSSGGQKSLGPPDRFLVESLVKVRTIMLRATGPYDHHVVESWKLLEIEDKALKF
jgi:hypothetical protein